MARFTLEYRATHGPFLCATRCYQSRDQQYLIALTFALVSTAT